MSDLAEIKKLLIIEKKAHLATLNKLYTATEFTQLRWVGMNITKQENDIAKLEAEAL